ncbi:MAG: preprotein translocase subunit YajC [Bacteroidota bacterium]
MTPILAQAAPGFDPSFLIMMGLIFVVFYFFIIRPQRNREKQHQAMIEALKKGDRVTTIGGIHGKVHSLDDGTVLVEVDGNTTKLRFDRKAIAAVQGKE